jgi:hypothetical protein
MARGRIGGLSISEIESILQQRRGELSKLRKQRAVMQRDLDKLDRRIESLGGGRARGGGRPRNTQSLTTILEEVLQKGSKPMQVGDIVDKVQAAGYRSSSANFRGIVNQTLIKDKRFTSAGRGLYQLKK